MKLLGYVLFLSTGIYSSCASNNITSNDMVEVHQNKLDKAEFQDSIILNNDGLIKYVTIDDEQFLFLEYEGKFVDTLSSCSFGLPIKNLGYLVQDFDSNFVLAQSFGSGNPHPVFLYNKKSGDNELHSNAYFIDVDSTSQTLFYSTSAVPTANDSLFSHNAATGIRIAYFFPQALLDEEEILNRIHIYKMDDSDVIMEIEFDNWSKKKQIKLQKQ